MMFVLKDSLSIEGENLLKACKSVCSSVPMSCQKRGTPTQSVEIGTLYHIFFQ